MSALAGRNTADAPQDTLTSRSQQIAARARSVFAMARNIEDQLVAPHNEKAGTPGSPPQPSPDHVVFALEDTQRSLDEISATLERIQNAI